MKNLCIVIQQNKKKEIEEIRTKYLPKTENKLDKYVNLMSLPQERQLSNQL